MQEINVISKTRINKPNPFGENAENCWEIQIQIEDQIKTTHLWDENDIPDEVIISNITSAIEECREGNPLYKYFNNLI